MKQKFIIKKISDSERRAIIHSNYMETLEITHLKKMNIWFGSQMCDVKVSFSNEIEKNEILLSSEVVELLLLPLYPIYEVILKNNELHLGPCIGILAAKNKVELEEKVQKLRRYVKKYQEIGGMIVAFSSDGVNTEKRTISGYAYDYKTKKWRKGEFPYPLSILRKSYFPNDLKLHLQSVIGDKIFNCYKFNKWEMYEWLKEFKDVRPHLPETSLYETFKDIALLLNKYHGVYIKPVKGMQGRRVAKVNMLREKIVIQMIVDGEKEDYYFDNLKDAENFIEKRFVPKKYIVQQPLNLHLKPEVVVDFRVILIKDETGQWKNFGVVARNGLAGNIVSNRHRGGKVEMANETLLSIFKDSEIVEDYVNKLGNVALAAAHAIEDCGFHFGKFGVDLGIDVSGDIWLIEINHRNPNDFVASFAGNKKLVDKIRLANMLYAKRLARF